jgi:hypothetical protein
VAIALGLAGWLLGLFGDEETARKRRVYDEEIEQQITKSSDLASDRQQMWQTVPGVGYPAPKFEVAPVSAINAASRVFATAELQGKTADEVAEVLGVQPRPKYGYNFPFYPSEKGVLVYRFDCGSFGWQFDVVFDAAGNVVEVQREGIE